MHDDIEDYARLPGLYRPWDFAQVILAGRKYRIEDVGVMADGGAFCRLCGARSGVDLRWSPINPQIGPGTKICQRV